MAAVAVILQQFLLSRKLHAHAANADDVGVRLERNRLDVLVDDFDLPVRGASAASVASPKRRIDRAFARQDVERPLRSSTSSPGTAD